jgi:hypothetical protein
MSQERTDTQTKRQTDPPSPPPPHTQTAPLRHADRPKTHIYPYIDVSERVHNLKPLEMETRCSPENDGGPRGSGWEIP